MNPLSVFGNSSHQASTDAAPATSKTPAHPLDERTGGIFSAETSGERAQRVRAWLATNPSQEHMQEVFRELSGKDKGAAKALREKLDEIKRSKNQEALVAEWAERAQQLLQAARFNIADGMAWQRDAAKAGAPLSRDPLSGLKQQLAERVKAVEDLQTRVQVHREAALLLTQRIEMFSSKSWHDADAAQTGLRADVQHWRQQADTIRTDSSWESVDLKYASQLDAAAQQLGLVVQAFDEALSASRLAVADKTQPLPPVPVWAEEIAIQRGDAVHAHTADAAGIESASAHAQQKEEAKVALDATMQMLKQELAAGNTKAVSAAAHALRQELKAHRKWLSAELEGQANSLLHEVGEMEGWQRWRADQIRQELVDKAEALIHRTAAPAPTQQSDQPETSSDSDVPPVAADVANVGVQADNITSAAEATAETGQAATTDADKTSTPSDAPLDATHTADTDTTQASTTASADAVAAPATQERVVSRAARPIKVVPEQRPLPTSPHSPRKLQELLRQLREQWKETDQGGAPNHALWKRFDAACNEAHRIVDVWVKEIKSQASEHKAARLALLDEITQWGQQLAEKAEGGVADWKAAHRELHQFTRRWREAGHLSEKVFAELQGRWKTALAQASAPLEAAQKASVQARHALIAQAQELGSADSLRIDAIRTLQQRWQQEAQHIPLERRQEQKLWDAFRKPIDAAFARKSQQREQAHAALNARDQAVVEAAQALQAASTTGNAQTIEAAMQALQAAMRQQQDGNNAAASSSDTVAAAESTPAQTTPVKAATPAAAGDEPAPRPPAASALAHRPAIAVRGDDRPQVRHAASRAGEEQRHSKGVADRRRPDARSDRRSSERPARAPRLGDAAFRAQRDAMEQAQSALRKLHTQARGEVVSHLLQAWQQRQPDAVPSAAELGKHVSNSQRHQWVNALSQAADAQQTAAAYTALLRLEMAAEAPTPAEYLNQRRALQLQLLTQRNDPQPAQTWVQDVGSVLQAPYDEAQARRLQTTLRTLLIRSR